MKVHPAAEAFPLLQGDEFDALVHDIKTNGQKQPVTFFGDVLLDGRNRISACEHLGIDYDAEEWDGKGTPVDYIASMNLHRRHLTVSQRSMAGSDLKPSFEKQAKENQRKGGNKAGVGRLKVAEPSCARDQAAEAVGVSGEYISKADRIKDADPELAQQIRDGEVTITQAERQVATSTNGRRLPQKKPAEVWSRGASNVENACGALDSLALKGLRESDRRELSGQLRSARTALSRAINRLEG